VIKTLEVPESYEIEFDLDGGPILASVNAEVFSVA
jgi:hypothetical protein